MKHPRSFSLAQTALVALSLPFGLSLEACGGGSSSIGNDNKDSNGIAEYETFEDLYHCSRSHYGELAHVADSDSIYECTSEDWVPVDDERLDELLAKSSSSRKDDAKSSSSIAVSEGDTAKVEQVKVDSAKVTGFAQKGPYASGTVVTLYELDKDFSHTKKKFTGKIDGEKGEFAISDIFVENQYAELEVKGFYMNELTGKATSGTKTKLTALVDLSEAKSVQANINLFTEFEKARVIELVKQNLNVPAAKKRATQEILKAFGVKDSEVASATVISLDDTDAAGVALQAASVMVIANQTIGKSNSLIAAIADDFAQNGTWTDVETRALVADKVQNLDSAGLLKTGARDNVLRDYWTSEYGIGKCTSELEEEVKKVENKESANYGAGFACTDSRWHKVGEIDAELGLCTAKNEGRISMIDEVSYYCAEGRWHKMTALESAIGLCRDSTSAKWKKSSSGDYFNCVANTWNAITEYEYNLQKLCTTGSKGAVEKDDEKGYVCEADGWRQLDDVEYKFGYCEPSIKDSVIWTGEFVGALPDPDDLEGQFLVCNGSKWVDSKRADFLYGVCNESMQGAYKDANSIIYENPGDSSYKWPDGCEAVTLCKNMKRIYYGDRPDLAYAKCENGEWIPSSYADVYMFRKNETCTGADDDRRVAYSKEVFACFQGKWYETIKDSRDDQVYRITKIGNQTWMAENLNFDLNGYLGTEKPMQSGCYGQGVKSFTEEEVAANCSNRGRLYAWSVAMDSAGLVDPDGPGKGCGYYEKIDCPNGKIRGICPSGWHLPDSTELDTLWNAVGGKNVAGIYLKSTSVWPPDKYSKKGEDSFGFTVLPSGLQSKNGSDLHYGRLDDLAAFWTSSDYSDTEAYRWFIYYDWDNTKYHNSDKRDWLSIRCVKD